MTWQTEFDEKLSRYIKNINVGQYDDAGVIIGFEKAKNIIKSFIQDLLDRKAREIEELKYELDGLGLKKVPVIWQTHNQTIDDALSILKDNHES